MTHREQQFADFWAAADDTQAERMLTEIRQLIGEEGEEDARGLFELASVHDYLGNEGEAVQIYRQAMAAGLSSKLLEQALIQLASSLRNIGEPLQAIEALEGYEFSEEYRLAAAAFLALALWDAGQESKALQHSLAAIADASPNYSRAVRSYAEDL